MKYLLAFLLLAVTAQAQTYPLRLVIVHRDDISDGTQLAWFRESLAQLPGKPYRLISAKVVKDVVKKNELKHYWGRLFDWAKHYRKPTIHTHYLLPPVYENGVDYGGGAAGATCTTTRNHSRKFSYSIMRLKNYRGQDRKESSLFATIHELLHTLGANHIDSLKNIMRSWYEPGPILFLSLTLTQLDYCRQGKDPGGKFSW